MIYLGHLLRQQRLLHKKMGDKAPKPQFHNRMNILKAFNNYWAEEFNLFPPDFVKSCKITEYK